jgi:hypothetical protein
MTAVPHNGQCPEQQNNNRMFRNNYQRWSSLVVPLHYNMAHLGLQMQKTASRYEEKLLISVADSRQGVVQQFENWAGTMNLSQYHVLYYVRPLYNSRWIRRKLLKRPWKYDVRCEVHYATSGSCPMAFYVTSGAGPSGSTDMLIGLNHLMREFLTQISEIIIKNSF